MTRNRDDAPSRPIEDEAPDRHLVSSLLTLLLIAPAAAVLASRVHGLVAIGQPDGSICSGTDLLWPIVQLGLPAIAMIIAIPVALLSLAHRARGWLWLTGALLGTLLLEVALRLWVPGCS